MAEPARPEVRYTAFLSYSHKDAAAAGRLHRRLETYRLPKRLIGTQTARGIVPERLWPVFRDREELPAATDLSETVREALAQSGALIVLCSPHSADSLWVAEEIEVFRRLHPSRPVLAAILDGDPPDCFPKALRAFGEDGTWHEPLATDLRRGQDGAQLGLLKLVAGITGVGLDALVQRDAARKIRRVTAVTGIALTAMLVMTALTWFALDARREAERQRAEAEGLVEFMLTDLRTRLRGSVGQLDIMAAVNQRALAYYTGRQDLAGLSAASRERRARIFHAIAEDEIMRGDIPAALRAIDAAYRTTLAQLAAAPNDEERLFHHAQSEYWMGRVHELRREWPAARLRFQRYAAAAARLLTVAPDSSRSMMEVAWSAQNLGTVELNQTGDFATARRHYEEAAHWFGRAARARPNDVEPALAQANAYAWLADGFFMEGLWQQSLHARRRQLAIVDRLHREYPDNLEISYRLAAAQNGVGRSLDKVGDRAGSRAFLLAALESATDLTQRDPHNGEWLLLRTSIQCGLYFGAQGQAGPNRVLLGRAIRAGRATLEAQGDPRASDLMRCERALN